MRTIHRMNNGPGMRAQCGATAEPTGAAVKLSTTGVLITCPACIGPNAAEIRERQLQTLARTAQQFRESRDETEARHYLESTPDEDGNPQ